MGIRKIAFFVEGYTEQIFLEKLLGEVFSSKQLEIEIVKMSGGVKTNFSFKIIRTSEITTETKYYILIYNCGGDSAIKSYILERRSNLIAAGYSKIVGLRDVYPDVQRGDIQKLLSGLNYGTPQKGIPIKFILSIMEIEGWFLAEENHYSKIDTKLTNKHIQTTFGFNPSSYNTELIDEPAIILRSIYQSVGKTYKKERQIIDRTINALDYVNIYFTLKERNPSLKQLIDEIDLMFEN